METNKTSPELMTSHERLCELGELLARGFLRTRLRISRDNDLISAGEQSVHRAVEKRIEPKKGNDT